MRAGALNTPPSFWYLPAVAETVDASEFLPPELPRPHKLRTRDGKKRTRRRLTVEIIDRLCRAVDALPFERKAAEACGISWHTLMGWKRTGRAYQQYLDDNNRPMDQRHPDYICLYLVAQIERVKAKKKARLLGEIEKDPDWRAKRYMLSIMDRDFAERRRQDWGLDLGDDIEPDEDESRQATELRISVIRSRPEPEDTNGVDATGEAQTPEDEA